MKIYKLLASNNQLPPADMVDIGDLAVLSHGDIMCYLGNGWRLIGGRFLPAPSRETFLKYIHEGWSDPNTIKWDLEKTFDTSEYPPPGVDPKSVEADPIWAKRFFDLVLETSQDVMRLTGNNIEI